MGHTCDDCGRTYETLSALRLHSCGASEQLRRRRKRDRRAREGAEDNLEDHLDGARAGDPDSAHVLFAQFQRELEQAFAGGRPTNTYRGVFRGLHEPILEAVDAVARTDGWPFLVDVASAYDPEADGEVPFVAAVITNVLGRGIVRGRLSDELERVPEEALAYLVSIPRFDDGSADMAWSESSNVGWAIGHPAYPVEETILELAPRHALWVRKSARRAMFADQREAVDLCCALLRELPREDGRLLLDSLRHLPREPDAECFPQYWDVRAEFDDPFAFAYEEPVESRLREVVEDLALVGDPGEEWRFADVDPDW